MAVRPNNLGQDGKHRWGILGKRKTYTNEAFKVIETERKNKKYDWTKRLKPWSAMDKGHLTVMMPAEDTGQTTTTTTQVPSVLWEQASGNWELTSQVWDNI